MFPSQRLSRVPQQHERFGLNQRSPPQKKERKKPLPRFERQIGSGVKGEKDTSLGLVQQCSEPNTEPSKGTLGPLSMKSQTLPFISLSNADRGLWYQQGLSFFFPPFKQGKRLWKVKLKKDSCLPYFLLLLFLFFFLFFFLRGFFSYFFNYYYYAQTKLPGENLNDSLRTADESNGLLKDFIYIIEHRENRESGTDKLTY